MPVRPRTDEVECATTAVLLALSAVGGTEGRGAVQMKWDARTARARQLLNFHYLALLIVSLRLFWHWYIICQNVPYLINNK